MSLFNSAGVAAAIFVVAAGAMYFKDFSADDAANVQVKPSARAAAKPAAPKPSAPGADNGSAAGPPSPFAAVEQAKKAGAGCLAALADISRMTIGSGHAAVSAWNRETPNQRAFAVLNFLKYDNQPLAPRSSLSRPPSAITATRAICASSRHGSAVRRSRPISPGGTARRRSLSTRGRCIRPTAPARPWS